MEAILNRLKEKIVALGERAFFNLPAGEEAIRDVEERMKITFPASIREFYKAFDGGFFADTTWSFDELKDPRQFETIQWNSNNILSLEEIKSGFGSRYHGCVPVIHTHTQEFLVFLNPLKDNESAIYDAFHEFQPHQWGALYSTFEELLNDYIDKEGNIKTLAI